MKRLLAAVSLGLCLTSANTSSEYRDLTDGEETALKAAASNAAGIEVWLIQANVIQADAGDSGRAIVIFEPANVSGFCMAPSAVFASESADRELVDWSPIEIGDIQYRFWYQNCEVADPQSPIVLKQFVDPAILEILRTNLRQIVGDAVRSFAPEREYNIPIMDHELRGVGIRFDPDHGPIYKLDYWGTKCRGLSINVLLRQNEIQVLRSTEWVC